MALRDHRKNRNNGTEPLPPDIKDTERAERLRELLEDLKEVNRLVPVIVEGPKDRNALRKLGLVGEVITFHRGKPVYEFCEDVAENHDRVVLLMDWDTQGERLQTKLGSDLKGHWEEFASFRSLLKILCQRDINDVEGIPKLLMRLEGNAVAWG
jgi:5S rRNA maturation endonuclease (ribonuclease M5)